MLMPINKKEKTKVKIISKFMKNSLRHKIKMDSQSMKRKRKKIKVQHVWIILRKNFILKNLRK